ncbi:unnamed protein product, partial [marine sediment metagenome]
LDRRIKELSVALVLPDVDRLIGSLSGGELRRVSLAVTLIKQPDLLLLDEPTNHIDTRTVEWIERFLENYSGACVLVTHDRYFLNRIVDRIVEIEFGELLNFPGNYETFLERKAARIEHAARAETRRKAILRRELAWLQRGARARTTKQKARIQRFEELNNASVRTYGEQASFKIPKPKRLGKRILETDNISRRFDETVLFEDLSLILQRDMRIGIVGPNGCGKTTLLRVLMGEDTPDTGRVFRGDTTEFLYVDQTHEEIKPDSTIIQHVSD